MINRWILNDLKWLVLSEYHAQHTHYLKMANILCQTKLISQLETHQTTKCIQYHRTIKFWNPSSLFFPSLVEAHAAEMLDVCLFWLSFIQEQHFWKLMLLLLLLSIKNCDFPPFTSSSEFFSVIFFCFFNNNICPCFCNALARVLAIRLIECKKSKKHHYLATLKR